MCHAARLANAILAANLQEVVDLRMTQAMDLHTCEMLI